MNPLRVALAGLGTVGGGTVRLLRENAALIEARAGCPVALVAVSARDRAKARGLDLGGAEWADDARQLAQRPDVDVVVELIGGAEGAARELCEKALGNGKAVVTANKALLAAHGTKLAQIAEEKGAALMFEAAVGGGIPVIKTLREALAGNAISSVRGILNGTCNYILTRMSREGLPFEEVLADAQRLGYAEVDPVADVDGFDAANKLVILTALAFGVKPDLASVTTEGLRRISPLDFRFAQELDCRIKLLGVARWTDKGIEQRVEPCLVPVSSSLAFVDDVLNAILIEGDAVGPLTLIGRGAGSAATASAVVGDIVDLARCAAPKPWGRPIDSFVEGFVLQSENRGGSWYIRLNVTDRPGVLADIAGVLRDEAISIETLLQHGRAKAHESVPLIIVTHQTNEAALRRAMEKLGRLEAVWEEPFSLRIENET